MRPKMPTMTPDATLHAMTLVNETLHSNEPETLLRLHAPPGACYESLTNNIAIPLMQFRGHQLAHDVCISSFTRPIRSDSQLTLRSRNGSFDIAKSLATFKTFLATQVWIRKHGSIPGSPMFARLGPSGRYPQHVSAVIQARES